MLFNSYIFIFLFLPLVLLGYYGLNHFKQNKLALVYVIGMSFWFYGYNSIEYLFILVLSILINYSLVELMSRCHKQGNRRVLLLLGLGWNIGSLFYYKYYDFFVENFNNVFQTDLAFLELVLPLGISFYTFQQMSYVIDYYKRECEKYSLIEYAAYVSFFPQLIAGPIVYHDELIPQFRDETSRKLNFDNMAKGVYAFALGLAKKVLIADTFSKIVTVGFSNMYELNATSTLLVMVCYSLQIYFDFSGYCDMAYGIGYMFNIKLPVNFNSPYKAASITEFWDRWHMTLTRFFTKYVYIPLGGSRKGKIRTYLNILIVFAVSGLWHGANWTFILWGCMNGVAKVIDRLCHKLIVKIPRVIGMVLTFGFSTFAWSLFRSKSVLHARILWSHFTTEPWGEVYQPLIDVFDEMVEIKFLHHFNVGGVMTLYPWLLLVLFTVLMTIISMTMKNTQEKVAVLKLTWKKSLVVVVLLGWSILSLSQVSEFLYFNF